MCTVISVNKPSDDSLISLTLHDGNDTTSPTIAKFCSTDDPPQRRQQTANLNFTSSGSQLMIRLKGRQSFTTPESTTAEHQPPLRRLPAEGTSVVHHIRVNRRRTPVATPSSAG